MSDAVIYKGDREDNTRRNQLIYYTILYAVLFIISMVVIYELVMLFMWGSAHIDQIGLAIIAIMFLCAFGLAAAIFGVVATSIWLIDSVEKLVIKDY